MAKAEKQEQKPKYRLNDDGKVRVRIMHAIGRYEHNKEYDLSPEEADQICGVRSKHDGTNVVKWRPAVPLHEIEELKKKSVLEGGLTQGEMTELGLKNIVPTPKEKAFEERLEAIRKGKPVAAIVENDEAGRAQAKAAMDKKMNEAKDKVLNQETG